jgi:hypothetical protein
MALDGFDIITNFGEAALNVIKPLNDSVKSGLLCGVHG